VEKVIVPMQRSALVKAMSLRLDVRTALRRIADVGLAGVQLGSQFIVACPHALAVSVNIVVA
jgi:hypothetical protein